MKKNNRSFRLLSKKKFVFSSLVIIFLFCFSITNLFFISLNNNNLNIEYVALNTPKEDYYERLDEVKGEYSEAQKDFSEMVITSAFSILSSNIEGFSFSDMSKGRMREIADLMLKGTEEEDGSITFSSKNEDEVKESLVDYFKSIDSSLDDVTYERMADDVYDYIASYEELIQKNESEESLNDFNSDSYWWPIGSEETTTSGGVTFASGDPVSSSITATFDGNDSVHNGSHGAIDISNDRGVGGTNIIASKDGVVIYPTSDSQTQYEDNGSINNNDGGGGGNYVVIQHYDGNYTHYAHLAKDSITVRAGDTVKQGQVIGKMGNSGTSTGPHLHFEIRVGGNDKASARDPLDYVSIDNPRPTGISSELLEWIGSMEGTGPTSGDYYIVYQNDGDIPTVGHGITLKYNRDLFIKYGYDPDSLTVGSKVLKKDADAMYAEIVQESLDSIKADLSLHGISLNINQIGALASLKFNCGNINGFYDAYQKYGSTNLLCSNWWEQKALHDSAGNYLSGLKKRRVAECKLFVNNTFESPY